MKVKIKNLGALKEAEFELGEFTILCGKNNTGKTYATYALFGFLSTWRKTFSIKIAENKISQLLTEGSIELNIQNIINDSQEIIKTACKNYTKELPGIFASSEKKFIGSEFFIELNERNLRPKSTFEHIVGTTTTKLFSISKKEDSNVVLISLLVEKDNDKYFIAPNSVKRMIDDSLKEIIFGNFFPNPFIASAERTGAAIFRKELNFARNRLVEEMSTMEKEINPIKFFSKVSSDYALPVKSNVDFTRKLEDFAQKDSFIAKNHPEILNDFADIIGGAYKVTRSDELYYIPKGKNIKLTMDESSSAVRSLLDIGFYLRHIALPGDLLMVDEPELNLHPENQRRIARLFARIVNKGIKVFITTHSDYIIKELNTLIMLNQFDSRLENLAKQEGYSNDELISSSKVKVYVAEEALIMKEGSLRKTWCHTLTPSDISPQLGIELKSFDSTIEDMNRIQEEIIWGEK